MPDLASFLLNKRYVINITAKIATSPPAKIAIKTRISMIHTLYFCTNVFFDSDSIYKRIK